MSKMDGDARGGAALSISQVTGLPIKFVGTGESMQALEMFHPDRVASRILGMGDILTLVERAQEAIGEDESNNIKRKMLKSTFNLEDFLEQIHQITKLGPLGQIMEMIPGFSTISKKISSDDIGDKNLKRMEAILYSMTVRERRNPNLINGSRKRRIAQGSGTTPQDINQLLNQFKQMQKILKQASSGKLPKNLMGMLK
jgi:signal recognition particle subunit SRP54